jgi:FkbM family methyltransferase
MDFSDRWGWLSRVRPAVVGNALLKMLSPPDRRRIVATSTGLRIYADPFSGLGGALRVSGVYEPEVTSLFQELLKPGMCVLDVGANEGYYSALAGVLCGPEGFVVAVEPQDRLQAIIEINARLNGVTSIRVFNRGFGGNEGERATINLYPDMNNGASSVVSSYRFSWRTQAFEFVSFQTLLVSSGRAAFDLMKVDVEGYEPEVVRHLLPHIARGQLTRLLLDYHEGILNRRGLNARAIHDALLAAGMQVERGDPARLSSYVLYRATPQSHTGEDAT